MIPLMGSKEILQICATVIASLGGGGLIVFGLSGYLGKIWADRGLEKQKQEYTQLNLKFQSQLDLATRRLQIELDALGHLHKLRTESEFEKVRELWKRVALVRGAFWSLPKAGLFLASADKNKQHEYHLEMSKQFTKRVAEAQILWSEETLSIPENIADASGDLLKIAQEEAVQAFLYPDPFDKDSMVGFDSTATKTFFDDRAKNLKAFDAGAEQLKAIMRKYLQGDKKEST
jgi:hypothetical protein